MKKLTSLCLGLMLGASVLMAGTAPAYAAQPNEAAVIEQVSVPSDEGFTIFKPFFDWGLIVGRA